MYDGIDSIHIYSKRCRQIERTRLENNVKNILITATLSLWFSRTQTLNRTVQCLMRKWKKVCIYTSQSVWCHILEQISCLQHDKRFDVDVNLQYTQSHLPSHKIPLFSPLILDSFFFLVLIWFYILLFVFFAPFHLSHICALHLARTGCELCAQCEKENDTKTALKRSNNLIFIVNFYWSKLSLHCLFVLSEYDLACRRDCVCTRAQVFFRVYAILHSNW